MFGVSVNRVFNDDFTPAHWDAPLSALTPLAVTVYEIWNEPDNAGFWRPAADPAAYADMYLKARAAIHDVDPDATVLVGGIAGDAGFVDAMYAARPELRGNVDAVGWHAYAPNVEGMVRGVRALRQKLDALGETQVSIHLTELGWPTSGNVPFALPEAARGPSMEVAADAFSRSDCGIDAVVAYTWTTPEKDAAAVEDWYGIRHADGSSTPTSDAFERVIARWDAQPVDDASRFRLCHPPDADGDGLPDAEDPDDDNDGVSDARDAFPLDPSESSDLDRDGIGDNADTDDDGD